MKHRSLLRGLILFMAAGCTLLAQVGEPVRVDSQLARQELEVLEGVLAATARFAGEESSGAGIQSYYLYRQGAVFVIPVRVSSVAWMGDFQRLERLLERASSGPVYNEELLRSMYRRLENLDRARATVEGELPAPEPLSALAPPPATPPVPPQAPPAPPAPEMPEAPAVVAGSPEYTQALEARMRAFEQNLQERKAEAETAKKERQARLQGLQEKLIEALARHADALTILGDDEYVTIILAEGLPFGMGAWRTESPTSRVLTVRKRSVLDYAAGRLSLEQFKQQVFVYEL